MLGRLAIAEEMSELQSSMALECDQSRKSACAEIYCLLMELNIEVRLGRPSLDAISVALQDLFQQVGMRIER